MRKTKLAGVLATSGLVVGLLAAPIAEAKPVGPPGQVCKTFLRTPAGQAMFTGRNAQGKCASFVARGGQLPGGTLPLPITSKRVGPPGQVCKTFLRTPAGQAMFTGRNAQGKCASFVARGGKLPVLTPPVNEGI